MIISFPPGAGGNWLKCVIENEFIGHSKVNFHYHRPNRHVAKVVHEFDTLKFDYLLSGDYYFNFFVNVVYKLFYYQLDFTNTSSFKEYYTECVNTARYLCQFETIKDHIFFNFNDLIYNDAKFYHNIISTAPNLNLSYLEFVDKKNLFFKTMVNTQNLYENFDNQIWVTFVLGQLMNHNITPEHFSIYEPGSKKLAAEFARKHYCYCKLTQIHHFNSSVFLPELL